MEVPFKGSWRGRIDDISIERVVKFRSLVENRLFDVSPTERQTKFSKLHEPLDQHPPFLPICCPFLWRLFLGILHNEIGDFFFVLNLISLGSEKVLRVVCAPFTEKLKIYMYM